MFTQHFPIVLASASPRRQQYLQEIGLSFTILPAAIDETPHFQEFAEVFARRMAHNKVKAVAQSNPASCTIAADTVVSLDSNIFGKPKNEDEALHFLKALSGKTHKVTTGVGIALPQHNIFEVFHTETMVTFSKLTEEVLIKYIKTGDPLDKAGAYGIQSFGGFLIHSITGSYSNVVGLPVNHLIHKLIEKKILS